MDDDKARRGFAPGFKREAVALLESGGRALIQVAAGLSIQPSMPRAWRALVQGGVARSRPKARIDAGSAPSGPLPADLADRQA